MLGLAIGPGIAAAKNEGGKIKCWHNKDGVRECGNAVPPEYAQQQSEEKDKSGLTVKTQERAKTQEELEAERATRQVEGVRTVAVDLTVRLSAERTDTDIAADADRALSMGRTSPTPIQAIVRHAVLTLVGTVPTLFDRVMAERAVQSVHGVRTLRNHVVVSAPAYAPIGPPDVVTDVVDECC